MGFETPDQLRLSSLCRMTVARPIVRLVQHGGRSDDDGGQGQVMDKPTGGAAQDQPVAVGHPFDQDAERMNGPTLLKKGPAAKYLRHDRS